MDKIDKQIELLNQFYRDVSYYKDLRIKLPVYVGGLVVGLTGYLVGDDSFPASEFERYSICAIIAVVGLYGFVSYRIAHSYFDDIAEDIIYLWKKIGMSGDEFFPPGG